METTVQHNGNFWYATPDIAVLWDNSVAPLTRFIFTILCSFATLKKRNAWPSNKTVAQIVGVSVATVKRAYKELKEKGIIFRVPRYMKNQGQTSSLTYLIGREADCYQMAYAIPEQHIEEPLDETEISDTPRFTHEPPPGSPMSREENDLKNFKESLKREAELPTSKTPKPEKTANPPEANNNSEKAKEKPVIRGACPDGSSTEECSAHKEVRRDNPKERYSPDDAPDIMRPTAEYFLQKTGRKGLRFEEIGVLREFSATQYPTRVQKEIVRACARLERKNKPLECLTLMYIAVALRDQPTWGPKAKKKAKKSEAKSATAPQYTEAELDAMQAEADALQAKLDAEDAERRRKLQ